MAWALLCPLLLAIPPSSAAAAMPVAIASEGKARLPVLVSTDASQEVKALAGELVDGLNKITGGQFQLKEGRHSDGAIVIGTDTEWPGVLPAPEEGLAASLCREDYLLKANAGSVWLIGRTELGVQNALWDFLHRLGFRQFLPGPHWEIWPSRPDISVGFNDFEKPDYFSRDLSSGGRLAWKEMQTEVRKWKVRNRLISGFTLKTSHAYGDILRQNRHHFDAHPHGMHGKEPLAKLDPSHSEVLEIAERYARKELADSGNQDSVSMEPSDGGYWRPDSPLGSPSNQAVTLANHVAKAIQHDFPGAKIGMYAYNEHSPAPDISVAPNVIISVATAFIKGGNSPESLIAAWRAKGAEIGIREYLGTAVWNKALPAQARAADLDYIASSIPRFHQLGARYYRTDASDAWGPYGVGYYLASRLLWDIDEAHKVPELLDDFFTRSFGRASGEMRIFFERYLFASGRPLLSEDLVGRMYRTLDRALAQSDTPEIAARITDLAIYTRYVELMLPYESAPREEKHALFEEIARFAYLIRDSGMVDRATVFRILGERATQRNREALSQMIESFRNEAPLEGDTVRTWIAEGIAKHQVHDFEPIAFSRDLVPYQPAAAPSSETSDYGRVISQRGTGSLYLYSEREGSVLRFRVRGGLLYGNRGPVRLALYADAHPLVGTPIATKEIPEDKTPHEVTFETPYTGLHRLEISDSNDRTEISWPAGQYAVFPTSPQERSAITTDAAFSFYLPPISQTVSGYSSDTRGKIWDEDGVAILDFTKFAGPGYFSIKVSEAREGRVWKISGFRNRAKKLLMTVPPYAARSASELLIPKEASAHP